ncbi:MAG: helix-turn-helix domain-containing protein, partial [Bacteroidetes bacterium]|nr:helix-turn-helix domain-containing protein [Bacteroidota bacterium]
DNEWLKSKEVMDLLKCSPGSLQNLRVSGALPFSKIRGTIYFSKKDIMRLLNKN